MVALVLGEPAAPRIRDLVVEYEVVAASAIARVEARAAFARARRARRLTPRREREAWARFESIWETSAVFDVDRTLLNAATELAGRHGLRGYDAVQLASAVRAADATGGRAFACLDGELNAAAAAEGLACVLG